MDTIVTANDVLIDILEDNRRRVHRVMNALPEACLYWSADGEANSIAVTLWHMGRLLDVFYTRQLHGHPAESECWFQRGWAQQIGYDPRGIGRDGWGSVNGYTSAEVAAIPAMTAEQQLGYLDDVYDSVRAYIETTPIAAMQTSGAGFEGRYTRYQCLQMALLDNIRHLGEILTLKALWERQQGLNVHAPPR